MESTLMTNPMNPTTPVGRSMSPPAAPAPRGRAGLGRRRPHRGVAAAHGTGPALPAVASCPDDQILDSSGSASRSPMWSRPPSIRSTPRGATATRCDHVLRSPAGSGSCPRSTESRATVRTPGCASVCRRTRRNSSSRKARSRPARSGCGPRGGFSRSSGLAANPTRSGRGRGRPPRRSRCATPRRCR